MSTQIEQKPPVLGHVIASYRGRSMQGRDFFSWYLTSLLIPLLLLAYGLWRMYDGRENFGIAAAESWGRPWFIAATIGLIPALLLMLRYLRAVRQSVTLHENGLRLRHISSQQSILLWNKISGIATETIQNRLLDRRLSTRIRVTMYPTTGDSIQLGARLRNLTNLTRGIKRRIYPRIYKEMRAKLSTEQWLYFGPLKINHETFHLRRDIPWDQIKEIRVASGSLIIELNKRKRYRIPTAKIPNLELLLKLIDEEIIL